jgi:regulation of enolase protein 1 (concanavalin A-like superfamily)
MRIASLVLVVLLSQEKVLFEEKFAGKLSDGWTWVREDAGGWKVDGGALKIKAQPGKIWYKTKTAKNLLVRKLPGAGTAEAPITMDVSVESAPEVTAEQCGMYLYFDEGNFVKIIREHVKGKNHVLLVREQKNLPEPQPPKEEAASPMRLRLTWAGAKVSGAYKTTGDWVPVGEVELPAGVTAGSVGLTAHGGAPDSDRWAKFADFRVTQASK